jgi:hypothetical protein
MTRFTHKPRLSVKRALVALAAAMVGVVAAPSASAAVAQAELVLCGGPCKLDVRVVGTGKGTITSVPAGLTCPPTCSMTVAGGTSVTLAAVAEPGSTFAGWSGCSPTEGAEERCLVTVNGATSVTARFVDPTAPPTLPALEVTVAGAGSGSVTSAPAGIDCRPQCRAEFAEGAQVTLTAAAPSGSAFVGWSGACAPVADGATSCVADLSESRTVGARFRIVTSTSSGCTLTGTSGDDVLRGTSRADVVCGLGGDDVIHGLGGNDVIRAGAGDDEVHAGPGADRIAGGPGHTTSSATAAATSSPEERRTTSSSAGPAPTC